MHREPDVGFDPGSQGPHPGPKAGAKPLRHPGIPLLYYFLNNIFFSLAYFIVRMQPLTHITHKILVDQLFMLSVRLPVNTGY